MRIISGKRRGAHLNTPDGGAVRPTADRVRQGLFNVLAAGAYGDVLKNTVIADVFAGVGSLGLECWSRGADRIVFIENNPAALKALHHNIDKLGCGDAATVISRDATTKLIWPVEPAGLVFLDPPWIHHDDDADLALLALDNLITHGAMAQDAIISIEHDHRRPAAVPAAIDILDVRKWGKTAITLGRYRG